MIFGSAASLHQSLERPIGEEKGRPMTVQLSESKRGYNPLAITAFFLGLISLLYVGAGLAELTDLLIEFLLPQLLLGACAVALGIAGIKQIKTTGQRGRGLAIAGCVAGVAVFAVLASLAVTLMVTGFGPASCAPGDPCY